MRLSNRSRADTGNAPSFSDAAAPPETPFVPELTFETTTSGFAASAFFFRRRSRVDVSGLVRVLGCEDIPGWVGGRVDWSLTLGVAEAAGLKRIKKINKKAGYKIEKQS